MSLTYVTDGSSLLDSPANILVNPVNCVPGVLGSGLAKAFADRWPGLKDAHRRAVEFGALSPGHGHMVWVTGEGGRPDPFGVYLLPTKDDWRRPSKLEWVADSLDGLAAEADRSSDPQWCGPRVRSIAVPAVGCGLGGLSWDAVHPLIRATCEGLPDVEWLVYPPMGWHPGPARPAKI